MTPDIPANPASNARGPVSSLLEKLDPAARHKLDRAIVDRNPSTYRDVYDQFQLQSAGVGFFAFYRYARRLRVVADRAHLAELTDPQDADLRSRLPDLLARELLDACLAPDVSPAHIHRLADAYRIAARTRIFLEEHDARLARPQRTPSDPEVQILLESARLLRAANQSARSTDEAARAAAAPARSAADAPHSAAPLGPTLSPLYPGGAGGVLEEERGS